MGASTVKVDKQTPFGSGLKMVTGTVKASTSYATGGDDMNLASYFKAAAVMTVMFGGGSNLTTNTVFTPAFVAGGTANDGKVRWFGVAGIGAGNHECNNALDISVLNVPFTAIGEQF